MSMGDASGRTSSVPATTESKSVSSIATIVLPRTCAPASRAFSRVRGRPTCAADRQHSHGLGARQLGAGDECGLADRSMPAVTSSAVVSEGSDCDSLRRRTCGLSRLQPAMRRPGGGGGIMFAISPRRVSRSPMKCRRVALLRLAGLARMLRSSARPSAMAVITQSMRASAATASLNARIAACPRPVPQDRLLRRSTGRCPRG